MFSCCYRNEGAGSTVRSQKTPAGARRRLPQTPAGDASERAASRIPASRAPREADRQPANQDMLSVQFQSARKSSIPSPARLHKHFSSNGDLAAERGGRQSPIPTRPASARPASRPQTLADRRGSVDPQAATRGRETRSRDAKPGPFDATAARRQLLKPTSQPEAVRGRRPSDSDLLLISRDSSGRHRIGGVNGNGNDSDASTNGSGKRLGSTRTMFNTQNILPDKPRAVTRSNDIDAMCLSGDELSVPRRKYRPPLVKSVSLSSSEEESTASRSSFTSPLSTSYDFNEYPDVAPPEDRALNEQMERLFEAYRLQELQRQVSNGDSSAPLSRASSTLSVQSEGPRRHRTGAAAGIERPASAQGTYRDSSRSTVPVDVRSRDSSRSRVPVDVRSRDSSRSRVTVNARSRDSSRSRVPVGARSRDLSRSRVPVDVRSRDSSRSRVPVGARSRDSSRSRNVTDDIYAQHVRPASERLARSRCRADVGQQPLTGQRQRSHSRNSRAATPAQSYSARESRDSSISKTFGDSSVNRQARNRPSRDSSVNRGSQNVSVNRPSRDSSVNRQSRNVNVNQPSRECSVSKQPRNVCTNHSSSDSSINVGARNQNVTRPPRDSSVTRQSRDVHVSMPSRVSSITRRSRDSSVGRGSRDSSVNRRSRGADVSSRQATKPPNRNGSCDDLVDNVCQRSSAQPETGVLTPEDDDKLCLTSDRPADDKLCLTTDRPADDKLCLTTDRPADDKLCLTTDRPADDTLWLTSDRPANDKLCLTSDRPADLLLETTLAKPRRDKRSYSRTRIPMPVDVKRRLEDKATNMSTLKRFDSGVDINNMSPTDSSLMGEDEAAMWNQNEAMTMANQPLSCQVDGRGEEYY